jgi:hypothetical protein
MTGNVSGRDAGMRRISRTSRWLLGGGLVLTGGLATLFGAHAQSSSAKPQVSTPPATSPVTTPPVTVGPSAGGAVRPVPATPAPVPVSPVPNVPVRPHTSSRGS